MLKLHAEECPDCPWNGETILVEVPRVESLRSLRQKKPFHGGIAVYDGARKDDPFQDIDLCEQEFNGLKESNALFKSFGEKREIK